MNRNDDPKIARRLVEKDMRRTARDLRELGIPINFMTFDEPMPELPDDGEGALINLTIGTRDKLTKREARAAGAKFREVVRRYPKAFVYPHLLGYDDDPRELPHIEDAARYIRRFARFAGIDDFETACAGPIGLQGAALLAACGTFGEEIRRQIIVPPAPTAQ
jgi:hypothetical protein